MRAEALLHVDDEQDRAFLVEPVGDVAHAGTLAAAGGRDAGLGERPDMRTPVTLLLIVVALAAAACGGAGGSEGEVVRETAAGAAQPEVVPAEPVLEDYRGKPLAIVFFHPL